MIVLGVTGGIGSGKTVVCEVFSHLGVPVYNADTEAKQLYISNLELQQKLKQVFPKNLFTEKGIPDAKKFASHFFDNQDALAELNALVHPFVREHFLAWQQLHKDQPYVVKEAAILFESGAFKDCHKVLTITAPEDLRIKRVVHRDKRSVTDIRRIIDKQWTDEERNAKADFVVINDESRLVLPQLLQVHRQMVKTAKEVM